MLGLGLATFLAYAFCIISAVVCVVYGAIMWNQNK